MTGALLEQRSEPHIEPELPLPVGPILVATDGSDGSDAALRLGWTLAERAGVVVEVASAFDPLPTAQELTELANLPALRVEQRERQIEAVRAQLARVLPASACEVELLDGSPGAALANHATARRARLLITGRARFGTNSMAVQSDTMARALRFGDVPVLGALPDVDAPPRRIIAAIDFSAYSLYAARVALSIAADDALIYLVHVRPRARYPGPTAARWEHQYATAAPAVLEGVRDALATNSNARIETIVLSGAAAPAIAAFADSAHADLVVAGTHGYGFLNRLVLGSVATGLMHIAPASLLCVPGSPTAHASVRNERSSRLVAHAVVRTSWSESMREFSRRFVGEPCTLEWMPSSGRLRTIEAGQPLVGAAYDERDNAVTIMTGAGRFDGPHTTHFVSDVRTIDELRDEEAEIRGVRIHGRHGVTAMRLLP